MKGGNSYLEKEIDLKSTYDEYYGRYMEVF